MELQYPFEGWDGFSKDEQWQSLSRQIEDRIKERLPLYKYESHVTRLDIVENHLHWILPLAKRLEDEPIFRCLYPHFHHAILDLKALPNTPWEVAIFAAESDVFELSLTRRHLQYRVRYNKRVCHGIEETITVLKSLL